MSLSRAKYSAMLRSVAAKRNRMVASNARRGISSEATIGLEKAHSANNYSPVPVVFAKAKGAAVLDCENKPYIDFLSAYGAVNQGHLHPRIIKAAKDQLSRLTLSSRAFHSDNFGRYSKFITKFFGYDSVLPMNTGAEGVETALKIARKWGYQVKGVKRGRGLIVNCTGCFHGRTLAAISMSDDPDSYDGYQPLAKGFIRVKYGDSDALEAVFKKHHRQIAGFIAEPVQGEAGVVLPPNGYFKKVRALCTKYNVLFIADEVQSGLGRTGKMLAIEHERVRPDIVILAKALGGGVLPVSAVLTDRKIMNVITPGTHGSTFGGNPVANAVAIESLKVLHREGLPRRSLRLGAVLLKRLRKIQAKYPVITATRGRGLFAAIDVRTDLLDGQAAYKLMKMLAKEGVLCKTTHGHTLRLSPPLVITKQQLLTALRIIEKCVAELHAMTAPKK